MCDWNAKQAGTMSDLPSFRGGDDGIRTHDPHVANVMLSQLSYIPTCMCAFAQKSILRVATLFVNKMRCSIQFQQIAVESNGTGLAFGAMRGSVPRRRP